jgi:hypothetical protein
MRSIWKNTCMQISEYKHAVQINESQVKDVHTFVYVYKQKHLSV